MSGRGRGRKINKDVVVSDTVTMAVVPVTPTVAKPRASRKKQFPIVAIITPDGIEGSLQPEARRPLIAHLPIQVRDVIFHDEPIKYDPQPPTEVMPFDSLLDNPFLEQSESLTGGIVAKVAQADIIPATPAAEGKADTIDYYRKGQLLIQYKGTDEIRKIPESSTTACMWCCHTFTGRPVVLPLHDHGDHLRVFGNFCCPECTMSYLFDSRQDSHTRWEQLALLNRVYADSVGGKIYPAPTRAVLSLFGGMYSIDEYRALIRQQKIRVDVHLPPMVSILATMDTKPIDFYDVSLTKNIMDSVKERLQKAEEVLKLRRTKPLKAWESTLDACINLRVGMI